MHDIRNLAVAVERLLNLRMDYLRTRNEASKVEFERLEAQVRSMCNEVLRSGQRDLFDGNG